MIRHHVRFAFRTLWRHRFYTLVDVVGLAVGMAACLLILLLVRDQKNIDRFHEEPENIYLVTVPQKRAGGLLHEGNISPGFGPILRDEVSVVAEATRLIPARLEFSNRGMSFELEGLYAEPSFFDVFSFRTMAGSTSGLLDRPGQVVLSSRASRRLFGNKDPVGEVLESDGQTYTVTGVTDNSDVRTHLSFEALFSFNSIERGNPVEWSRTWNTATYVRLHPDASAESVETALRGLSEQELGMSSLSFRLIRLTDMPLGPAVRSSVSAGSVPWVAVLILGLLACSILLAAVLNYTALATARYMARATEYGVRKVVGAGRRHVIEQLVVESILVTVLALLLGRWVLGILVSGFNQLSLARQLGVYIDPATLSDPMLLGSFVLFAILVGATGGLIPGLRLARLEPATVLRGGIASGDAGGPFRFRKLLTVGQMTFALVLMVTTVAVYRQTDFMLSYDYGFRTDDVLLVDLKGNDPEAFLSSVDQHAGVEQAVAASSTPGLGRYATTHLIAQQDSVAAAEFSAGAGFLEVLDIDLLAGTGMSGASSNDILINAAAADRLGYESPFEAVGRTVEISSSGTTMTIRGVMEDIQFDTLNREVGPMVLVQDDEAFRSVLVRTRPGSTQLVGAYIESEWRQIDPIHPASVISYGAALADSGFVKRLQDFVRLVGLMAVFSLVITCLGLTSMAAFRARVRRKEIGIRKALGAGVASVVWLLSREILLLMAFAVLFATPMAWLGNRVWLEFFAQRISFGPELIVMSAGIVLTATLTAVASQSFRAARLNPVDVIRNE